MTQLRIMSVGSCFAAFTANCLSRVDLQGFRRVSSVQHTRIDQMLSYCVTQSVPLLKSTDTTCVPQETFKFVSDNQFSDRLFGRSLPYGMNPEDLSHSLVAMTSGVDILLIDNFADILFRIYRNPSSGQSVYGRTDRSLHADPRF